MESRDPAGKHPKSPAEPVLELIQPTATGDEACDPHSAVNDTSCIPWHNDADSSVNRPRGRWGSKTPNVASPSYQKENLGSNRIHFQVEDRQDASAAVDHATRILAAERALPDPPNDAVRVLIDNLARHCFKGEEKMMMAALNRFLFPNLLDPVYGETSGLQMSQSRPMAYHLVPQHFTTRDHVAQPKPDLLFGYSSKRNGGAFHASHIKAHEMLYAENPHRTKATGDGMCFPFLSVQYAMGGEVGTLWAAANQCFGAAAACLMTVNRLNATILSFEEEMEKDKDNDMLTRQSDVVEKIVYTITIDQNLAQIFVASVYYYSIRVQLVDTFVLDRHHELIKFRQQVLNIFDWAEEERLSAIRNGLDRVAAEVACGAKIAPAEEFCRPEPELTKNSHDTGGKRLKLLHNTEGSRLPVQGCDKTPLTANQPGGTPSKNEPTFDVPVPLKGDNTIDDNASLQSRSRSSSVSSTHSAFFKSNYRDACLAKYGILIKPIIDALHNISSHVLRVVHADGPTTGVSAEQMQKTLHILAFMAGLPNDDHWQGLYDEIVFPGIVDKEFGRHMGLHCGRGVKMMRHHLPEPRQNCSPLELPQPTRLFGYRPTRGNDAISGDFGQAWFSTKDLVHPEISGFGGASADTLVTFPFLVSEGEGEEGVNKNIWVAINQCAGAAVACLNIVGQLNKILNQGRPEGSGPHPCTVQNVVYAVAVDNRCADIYVAWKNENQEGADKYILHQVAAFLVGHAEHLASFRRCVHNILRWGLGERRKAIGKALQALKEQSGGKGEESKVKKEEV